MITQYSIKHGKQSIEIMHRITHRQLQTNK